MSRHSNDPSRALVEARAAGYTAARVAQGVPVLDRDLNLLGELAAQTVREVLCRYLGDGLVSDSKAFEVRVTSDRKGVELGGPGWAVVAGMEVSIDATQALDIDPITYELPPESDAAVKPVTNELWCWLEVWLTEVDEAKDPALANADDVGVLTSTRWRPTWTTRKTTSNAAPTLEVGHHALPLACVRRTGTNTEIEDLRPVGLTLGQQGAATGRLTLWDKNHNTTREPKLVAILTGEGLSLKSSKSSSSMIELNTRTGAGTFQGAVKFPQSADCAERFPLAHEQVAPPGTVLVTSTDEALRPCDQPYDTRVVGVVSGAGGLKPGIVLNDALADGAVVALVGRVYCKVDASFGAIAVGDLLTTSSTPGHAMKAADRERAFGAVLGKALGALAEGQGLIPILVTLQ